MVSFGTYVPPGVYVDTGTTPTVASVGVNPTIACLIGSGIGYNTYSETLSFASSATLTLAKNGINASSIVVTGYVTDPNASGQSIGHTFVAGSSGSNNNDYYPITTIPGGGTAATSTTTITKTAGSQISTAYPQVTVTYQYTDASYFALNKFTDYTSFTDVYGPPFDPTTGALTSPLSLAAQVAIQNGANQLYAIALDGTGSTQQQFSDAYSLLSSNNVDANLVVPLWKGMTDPTALSGMLATLNAALQSDAQKSVLRMAMVGFDQAYAPTTTALATLATQIASNRIVLAWPNQLNLFNGVTQTTITVDGLYLAAAYAGILSAQAPQIPLTFKHPQGFGGLPRAMASQLTPAAKNTLSSAGISVSEIARNGVLRVRQGLTTNYAGGVLTREISLVRQADELYDLVQDQLDAANLVGQPITSTTALAVKGIVTGALETAVLSGLILGYSGLAVREQVPPGGDPTVIEVQFAYQPSYPLNYVLVNFNVDTTTGITTVNSANITGTTAATAGTTVGAV